MDNWRKVLDNGKMIIFNHRSQNRSVQLRKTPSLKYTIDVYYNYQKRTVKSGLTKTQALVYAKLLMAKN